MTRRVGGGGGPGVGGYRVHFVFLLYDLNPLTAGAAYIRVFVF